MSKNYSGEGHVIDVTLTAAATAGVPFILGTMLVVPITDGAIGDTIACSMNGVFNLLGVTGAAISQGDDVSYIVASGLIDDNGATLAAGDLSKSLVAMETKTLAAGERILVKINQASNTVT